jgi:LAO/AO transport system kinase
MINLDNYIQRLLQGDIIAAAKSITIIENNPDQGCEIIRKIFPHTGNAYVIGVTGPPGAGKSTLTSAIVEVYRKSRKTVGVIAIDSSSPFSGGSVLGDRIRMQKHFRDDQGVFIRSMATRGHLGGLSKGTQGARFVMDAMGMDVIIIETVGVGQAEVDIARIADTTLLVLAPGLGDHIQTLKAGIMEIGDIFVVNKADLEGTDVAVGYIEYALRLRPPNRVWHPEVFKTVALELEGIDELVAGIARHRQAIAESGAKSSRAYDLRLFVDTIKERLIQRIANSSSGRERLSELSERIGKKEIDPYTASDLILAEIFGPSSN